MSNGGNAAEFKVGDLVIILGSKAKPGLWRVFSVARFMPDDQLCDLDPVSGTGYDGRPSHWIARYSVDLRYCCIQRLAMARDRHRQ